MQGFHSYFVTPRGKAGVVEFCRFELLTWVASAVQWRNLYSNLDFVTDAEGLKVLSALELGGLYDNVRVIDTPFSDINPEVFWAAGKIVAMQAYLGRDNVFSIDTDCVIWRPLFLDDRLALVGLNYDNPKFYEVVTNFYRELFINWPLDSSPVNAAILGFQGLCGLGSLLDIFTKVSLKFMREASKRSNLDSASMIFAEQKLSAEVCTRMGMHYGVLCKADESNGYHIEVDDNYRYITHLWDTKALYRDSKVHRDAYIDWLAKGVEPNLGKYKPIWDKIYSLNDVVVI